MKSFPFDSHVTYDASGAPSYDRAISSEPYRKLIKELFKTGILPTDSTNMQVTAGENMTVQIGAGFAVVEGCMSLEEADRTIEITASETLDRIDTVVLRLNTNDDYRTCDYYVVKGTASSTPTRPDLTRTASIYEIGLADVFIPANTTAISDEKITDTRYESERCGVISSISEFDTTTLYQQIQADLKSFKEGEETSFSTWSTSEKATFEEWFETIRGILGKDEAGKLQNEIDAITGITNDEIDAMLA